MPDSHPWDQYWRLDDGSLPPTIAQLHDMNPVAAQTYTDLRAWLFEQRDGGFDRGQKELLFAILDIFCDHAWGATWHTRNALEAGVPVVQVRELLTMVIMTQGINSFAEIGSQIWKVCQDYSLQHPQ